LLDLSDPQLLQGYGYAGNDPVTRSDPTGLDPCISGGTGCHYDGTDDWHRYIAPGTPDCTANSTANNCEIHHANVQSAKRFALRLRYGAVDPDDPGRPLDLHCRVDPNGCDGAVMALRLGANPDFVRAGVECGGTHADQQCMVDDGVPPWQVGLPPTTGNVTVAGFCLSAMAMAGYALGGEICIVGDETGMGITATRYTGGSSLPIGGVSLSVGMVTTDTDRIENLKGPFQYGAGSIGEGETLDGTYAWGSTDDGTPVHTLYVGDGIGLNLPVPGSGHGGESTTVVCRFTTEKLKDFIHHGRWGCVR
jgi:hypothetical protein